MNTATLNTSEIALEKTSIAIVKTLLYFNIFNHPLLASEIVEFSTIEHDELSNVQHHLDELVEKGLIYKIGKFYAITDKALYVDRRIKGNEQAAIYLKRAKIVSRVISWFPYVRGVMISGSLSKGYMDKGSDIDYFIVTEQSRLWVCRSILALFRKVMVGALRKYFCINYFVSTATLNIPDKNLFTATEIVSVYPTYGQLAYYKLQQENSWVKEYFPNKKTNEITINNSTYPFSIKAAVEFLLNGKMGEKLDAYLFSLMLKRWKKRYADFDETQFDLNIRTRKNVSKQHEKGHQFVILQKFMEQIDNFEKLHKVKLVHG